MTSANLTDVTDNSKIRKVVGKKWHLMALLLPCVVVGNNAAVR